LPADWAKEKADTWETVIKKMQDIVGQLAKDYKTILNYSLVKS